MQPVVELGIGCACFTTVASVSNGEHAATGESEIGYVVVVSGECRKDQSPSVLKSFDHGARVSESWVSLGAVMHLCTLYAAKRHQAYLTTGARGFLERALSAANLCEHRSVVGRQLSASVHAWAD